MMGVYVRKVVLWPYIVILAAVGGFAAGWFLRPDTPREEPLPVLGRVPDYTMTDQLGRPVSSTSFHDKVRIVTFLFPYCRGYCPLIAHNLMTLERVLKTAGMADQVQLISFNVDPENTGPFQMKAFQQQYGWDPSDPHWEYLTGPPEEVRRIVTDAYHVFFEKVRDADEDRSSQEGEIEQDSVPEPVVSNPLADDAGVDYDIVHNDMLVIVDKEARIRKMLGEADRVSDEEIMDVIHQLLLPDFPRSAH
jgi:protein SCO1/2